MNEISFHLTRSTVLSRRRRRQHKAPCVSAGLELKNRFKLSKIATAVYFQRAVTRIRGLEILLTIYPALTHGALCLPPAFAGLNQNITQGELFVNTTYSNNRFQLLVRMHAMNLQLLDSAKDSFTSSLQQARAVST